MKHASFRGESSRFKHLATTDLNYLFKNSKVGHLLNTSLGFFLILTVFLSLFYCMFVPVHSLEGADGMEYLAQNPVTDFSAARPQ